MSRGWAASIRCLALAACLTSAACAIVDASRGQLPSDSMDELWAGEASQAGLRQVQSRSFEGVDRLAVLSCVIELMQDLGFSIGVLDEELGVVSGKLLRSAAETWQRSTPGVWIPEPSYSLYETDSLLAFSPRFRTMGPFVHREDLIRLTVTVRRGGERRLVVRASAQFVMRALEDPEPYQRFFAFLESRLRTQGGLLDEGS